MQLDGQTNVSIQMCVTKKSLAHQLSCIQKVSDLTFSTTELSCYRKGESILSILSTQTGDSTRTWKKDDVHF